MTQTAQAFDDRVAQLLADPLSAARQAAAAGRPVVGYLGAESPVELILAAGALPVRLRGQWSAPTPHADEYLESAFVPEVRAVAEQWCSGALDFVGAVILPRSHDSAQRLYYYACELQRRGLCGGPKPLLHDVAAIARETSFAHTRVSTALLARDLGAAEAGLARALQRTAERGALLRTLDALRVDGAPLPGSAGLRVLRAAEYDWAESFDHALARWLEQWSHGAGASRRRDVGPPRLPPAKRVLLAGSIPPDERLHLAVEAAGGTVVRELIETDCASAGAGAGAAGDIAHEAIARRSHGARTPAQRMLESPDWLAEQARAVRACGVVLWLIEEDEALPWEANRQTRALQAAGIAVLVLTRQPWLADSAALQAVGDFVRGLEVAP